jgi:hypothetical protein
MTTAVDSNVLIALWDTDPSLNIAVQESLDAAQQRGALVISGAVYAELLALPGRTEKILDSFLEATSIRVEWGAGEQIWRAAGRAFQGYVVRRRSSKADVPRRILADFLIGAHASVNHHRLLTLDQRLYKAAFPKLEIIAI